MTASGMVLMLASARNRVEIAEVERRRHQRVSVSLSGRYMRVDRREYDCTTIDMSPGGLALQAEAGAHIGERIVVYLNQVGRVEGICARTFDGGFAMTMQLPALKRERLADQLTWLANRQGLGLAEDRRHARIVPRFAHSTLKLASGLERRAKLLDISRSGAAMTVDAKVAIGAPVTVGRTPAQVVRLFPGGLAVEFNRIVPEERFNDDYVV